MKVFYDIFFFFFFSRVKDSLRQIVAVYDKLYTPYLLCSLYRQEDPVSGTDRWVEEKSYLPKHLYALVDSRRAALQEALTHNGFEIAASGRRTHHSPEYKVWRIQCVRTATSIPASSFPHLDKGSDQWHPSRETDCFCLTDINMYRKQDVVG